MTRTASRRDRKEPLSRWAITDGGRLWMSPSETSTIPTSRAPTALSPFASAEAKVARPQCVGGNVLITATVGMFPADGCSGDHGINLMGLSGRTIERISDHHRDVDDAAMTSSWPLHPAEE
jgi:hypothetical protein